MAYFKLFHPKLLSIILGYFTLKYSKLLLVIEEYVTLNYFRLLYPKLLLIFLISQKLSFSCKINKYSINQNSSMVEVLVFILPYVDEKVLNDPQCTII
jgi:hypothetical protein